MMSPMGKKCLLALVMILTSITVVNAYNWRYRGGGWGWRRPYYGGWAGGYYPYWGAPYYSPYYYPYGLGFTINTGSSKSSYKRGYRDAQIQYLEEERRRLEQENEELMLKTTKKEKKQ